MEPERDVDFVVGAVPDGVDEELPQPERRQWPALRRLEIPLGVLVVVGLVLAFAFRVIGPSSGKHPAAVPTTGPTAVIAGDLPVRQFPLGPQLITIDVGEVCARAAACIVSNSVPKSAEAAVRQRLPAATQILGSTAVGRLTGNGKLVLLAMRLTARLGTEHITITVRRDMGNQTDEAGRSDTAAGSTVYAHKYVGHYYVQVDVRAPTGSLMPNIAAVFALVNDKRLERHS